MNPSSSLRIHTHGNSFRTCSAYTSALCGQAAGGWTDATGRRGFYGGPVVSKEAFLFVPARVRCHGCDNRVWWRHDGPAKLSYQVRVEIGVALHDRHISFRSRRRRLFTRLLRNGAAIAELPKRPFAWSDVDVAIPSALPRFEIGGGLAWSEGADDLTIVFTIAVPKKPATLGIGRDLLTEPRWLLWDAHDDRWKHV